jgi:hypothetical protein
MKVFTTLGDGIAALKLEERPIPARADLQAEK